jgi:hypothetical protein
MSSTLNLDIVFTSFLLLEEKIWTRGPLVTAKVSAGGEAVSLIGGGGKEIEVMGVSFCEGRSRSEEKVFQYFCSGVRVEGPVGSFTRWRGWTSAAIVGGRGGVVEWLSGGEVKMVEVEILIFGGPCGAKISGTQHHARGASNVVDLCSSIIKIEFQTDGITVLSSRFRWTLSTSRFACMMTLSGVL